MQAEASKLPGYTTKHQPRMMPCRPERQRAEIPPRLVTVLSVSDQEDYLGAMTQNDYGQRQASAI